MKRFILKLFLNIVAVIILLPTVCKGNEKVVYFAKGGEFVFNPGQGWVLYELPSNQNAATIALGTTGYNRFKWSLINPQKDIYDWSDIDNHISQWAAHGKQFAFGIMFLSPESDSSNVPQ